MTGKLSGSSFTTSRTVVSERLHKGTLLLHNSTLGMNTMSLQKVKSSDDDYNANVQMQMQMTRYVHNYSTITSVHHSKHPAKFPMTDTHTVSKHHLVPFLPSTSSTETLPPFSRSCTLCLPPNTSSETECRPSLLHRTLPNLLTAHPGMQGLGCVCYQ